MHLIFIKDKPFIVDGDTLVPADLEKTCEIKKVPKDARTVLQNRAVHLYCKQVAQALNDKNLTVTAVLKPEIKFSMLTVKEQLFKPILSALAGKNSTMAMSTKEINDVYDVMNKALSEKFGIYVAFPSQDGLNFEQNYK